MRILDLARKDILQILRDWKSALFLVIMPILFTVFFGLIFGAMFSGEKDPADPRLPVGFINQDAEGLISAGLETLLPYSDVVLPIALRGEQVDQANELVVEGEYAAVVRVPPDYSQTVRAGEAASLEVIADQSTASGQTVVNALETITGRLLGSVESAQISVQEYEQQIGFQDEASRQGYFEEAFLESVRAWSEPALTVRVDQAIGQANLNSGNSGFTQSSAGMIVQFAFFGLISSGMILVLERKNGAMQRLLTTPIRRAEVIAGHTLAMFLVVLAQEFLLITLGQFAFGVDYLRQPLAVLLMMLALALFTASLGLLISALSKREDQVILLCLIAMFVFSALGGAWFPLEVTSEAFSFIGHLLPSAWAMDGFQNIIVRGLAFNAVLLPAGLLILYALVFFGFAIWRFKFE